MLLVRALFVAAPLLLLVQTYALDGFREPYPALRQPAFGGFVPDDGIARASEPVVVARYPDGTVAEFDHLDVVGDVPVLPSTILQSAFGADTPRRTDPENAAWLAGRITALSGGREPASAVIEWRTTGYDVRGSAPPVTEVTRTVEVDFEAAGVSGG